MKNIKCAAVSSRISTECREKLLDYCDEVFEVPADDFLPAPVCHHPDMVFTVVGNSFICHRSYYERNRDALSRFLLKCGLVPVLSECRREARYPFDIAFNVLQCGRYLFCNIDHTASEVLSAAERVGLEPVKVRQGYAGCSAIATGKAVITSDPSILKGCLGRCDTVDMGRVDISLPPYDTGFIGGAGGYCDGKLFTYGRIPPQILSRKREDGTIFDAFRNAGITETVPLCETGLFDLGGIKFFN